jgi:hypothetical protein
MKGLAIPGRITAQASYGLRPTDQHYIVTALVADDLSDRPYLAECDFGAGEAASVAAQALAIRLRKGSPVVMHGMGLKDFRFRGAWVRRVLACELIDSQVQPPHHEPSNSVEAA